MEENNSGDLAVVKETTTTVARPHRDRLLRGYNKRNPDNVLEDDTDDEVLFERLGDAYKNLETSRDNMMEENSMLVDAISNNAEAKGLLDELLGVDKEGNSKIIAEMQRRREGLKRDRELQDEFDKNFKRSIDENVVSAFVELDATDEEKEKTWSFMENLLSGNISKEMIVDYVQGLRHDADADAAMETGKIAERNAKIQAMKAKLQSGDNLPLPKPASVPTEKKAGLNLPEYRRFADVADATRGK